MRRLLVITVAALLVVVAILGLQRFIRDDTLQSSGSGDSKDRNEIVPGASIDTGLVGAKTRKGRKDKVSLSVAGKTALAKYESVLAFDTNSSVLKQEEEARKQQIIMLAAIKTPRQLLDYLRKTGDYDGSLQKLREFVSKGRESAIEEITKALSPEDSEDVLMFVGLMFADMGTAKAVSSLFFVFDILPENSDAKRDLGEVIATVTNTESKALLIDTMISSTNTTVSDIAQRALANMANKDVIVALLDGYLGAQDQGERELFADTVRHMRQPEMVPALKYIVDGEKGGDFDAIGLAACDTLGIIGTREATDCLVQNFNGVTNAVTATAICAAIEKVGNPESFDLILDMARGNAVSSTLRLASISALRNYDYGLVGQVLQDMVNDSQDVQIREAARRSLEKVLRYRSR